MQAEQRGQEAEEVADIDAHNESRREENGIVTDFEISEITEAAATYSQISGNWLRRRTMPIFPHNLSIFSPTLI